MKNFPFLSIIFLFNRFFVQAVVFEGSCPSLNYVKSQFVCSDNITSGSYRVAAYLPVAGDTLNIFFNPFESINCLDLGISCSYASGRNVQLRYNCYPTMAGNVTSGVVTQCVPLTFDPYRFDRGLNQISTFGFGLQLICREKLVDFQTTLIFDENNTFLGIFGCRDLPDNQHEEGAWVVVTTNKDLPDPNYALNVFRDAVKNVSSANSWDFAVNDFSLEHSCTCSQCTYGMECPAEPKEDDYSYYNYYESINYDYYPQYYDYGYDDYYSYYEEEPPKEDQPVYYYYYDENYTYTDYYGGAYVDYRDYYSYGPNDYYYDGYPDYYGDSYYYDYGGQNSTFNESTTENAWNTTETSTWASTIVSEISSTEGSFVTETSFGEDFVTVEVDFGKNSTENYDLAGNDTVE